MGAIKILNKGLLTSIQDLGRRGYQQYGVPIAGAMDEYSHQIANLLVDNSVTEATMEVTMLGPKIQFLDQTTIAITGGNLQPKINNTPVEMWQAITVTKDDVLSFAGLKSGLRSYIAFAGGLDVQEPMGSQSYYARADLGTKIKNGQVLTINGNQQSIEKTLEESYRPTVNTTIECRVVLGPQDDCFSDEAIEQFFSSDYKVTNDSDRMGYRLAGATIDHKETPDIISDGLGKGAIQIPGNGQPIVMMSDAQTTGGYTKIGYVIKSDLNRLAQLKPGNTITFKKISIEQAQALYCDYVKRIDEIKDALAINRELTQYKISINGNQYDVSVEVI